MSQVSQGTTLTGNTEERLTHQFISDVFMISNEPGQKSTKGESKVYLHGLS